MLCFKKNREPVVIKSGAKYNDIKCLIKPLDLILFKGGDAISDTIRRLERYKLGKNAGKFSHVGMILTSEVLDDKRIEPGKLYIWESTMSGELGDGTPNINGDAFFGVQLRDFDAVVKSYDSHSETRIAWSELEQNPAATSNKKVKKKLRKKITRIFKKYDGTTYDFNPLSLGGSLFSCIRPMRKWVDHDADDWLFCSELCFMVYQKLGLYDKKYKPENVVPMDFIGYDNDGIAHIFSEPIYIVF